MKNIHALAAVFSLLLVSTFAPGCSNDSPLEPSSADEQYFQRVVSGNDEETRDLFTSDIEALNESADFNLLGSTFRKEIAALGPITPIKFGRSIRNVSRSIIGPATMQGDSIALVHTQIIITGDFVVKAVTPSGIVTLRKPFTETLYRNLRFVRVWDDDGRKRDDDRDLFKWKLAAVSVINGGTVPPSSVFQSVELITAKDTFTVTNPDEYFMASKHPWKVKMPKLKDKPITVRVTLISNSPDPEDVALHHLVAESGLRKQMFTLVSESDVAGLFTRVYERTWYSKIKAKKKYGHLVVSALSNASVHDDDTQLYASTIWGIPYLPNE
ncbi:MAG: hypothetical protein M5R41_13915 [Bacteroidia bacterium]|nr:hypothetical protein [Bacteroidia bacterium]